METIGKRLYEKNQLVEYSHLAHQLSLDLKFL